MPVPAKYFFRNVEMGSKGLERLFPHSLYSSRWSSCTYRSLYSLYLLSSHRILSLHLFPYPLNFEHLHQRRRAWKWKQNKRDKGDLGM